MLTVQLHKAPEEMNHFSTVYRITEWQNGRGWKGPLWVI